MKRKMVYIFFLCIIVCIFVIYDFSYYIGLITEIWQKIIHENSNDGGIVVGIIPKRRRQSMSNIKIDKINDVLSVTLNNNIDQPPSEWILWKNESIFDVYKNTMIDKEEEKNEVYFYCFERKKNLKFVIIITYFFS